ncbi:MAG TPA: SufE family protein [Kiritimatiellia bacterium]|nr:SufE family protein [Kiritimatiellia bacterium]
MDSILQQRADDLMGELMLLPDPRERLSHLIDLARRDPPLPESERIEANEVEGCMSTLWLAASFEQGLCRFRCQSDALVVQAIAGLLCRFYDQTPPHDILRHSPDFLAIAGILDHLSSNRRNALSRVWKIIRLFAAQHQQPATATT